MFGKQKKLSPNRETVRALAGQEMQELVGGVLVNFARFAHCSENCCSKSCNTCGCPRFDFNIAINPGY